MNAQQMIIEYANSKRNELHSDMTDQELVGAMFAEGIVIERTLKQVKSARIHRQGRTITVVETTSTKINEVVDGRLVSRDVKTDSEVMRVEL